MPFYTLHIEELNYQQKICFISIEDLTNLGINNPSVGIFARNSNRAQKFWISQHFNRIHNKEYIFPLTTLQFDKRYIFMNKFKITFVSLFSVTVINICANAQNLKDRDVPQSVKAAFAKKYPEAKKVNWEKEKGNFEANWGGKSGEDSSATFTPSAVFLEIVVAIPIKQLPANVAQYIKKHYSGAKIKEAGKVTDAEGKHMFEAEIKGKDLIFDENGTFIKED